VRFRVFRFLELRNKWRRLLYDLFLATVRFDSGSPIGTPRITVEAKRVENALAFILRELALAEIDPNIDKAPAVVAVGRCCGDREVTNDVDLASNEFDGDQDYVIRELHRRTADRIVEGFVGVLVELN
jgi:hypothetical protein